MVAIGSFGRNLERAVEQQTKGLLGADLMVQSRDEFNDKQRAFLDSVGDAQSDQVLFSSMVLFPKGQGTRLAQVGALNGDFPLLRRSGNRARRMAGNDSRTAKARWSKTV